MKLAVADTSPVNYLIPIGHIKLLPCLFERVVLPTAAQAELSTAIAPAQVRRWIISPPPWIEITEANELDLIGQRRDCGYFSGRFHPC